MAAVAAAAAAAAAAAFAAVATETDVGDAGEVRDVEEELLDDMAAARAADAPPMGYVTCEARIFVDLWGVERGERVCVSR
jgi:hypothetical protein